MKMVLFSLLLVVLLGACQGSPLKSYPSHIQQQSSVSCERISVATLLEEKEWDDIYKMFLVKNEQPLDQATLIEFIQGSFSVFEYLGSTRIGVELGSNDIGVQSELATVTPEGPNYRLDLKEDQLQFLLAQNFNASNTVQFKKKTDSNFQDLCVDSDPHVIAAIKLVFFRSAVTMYMRTLKNQGYF